MSLFSIDTDNTFGQHNDFPINKEILSNIIFIYSIDNCYSKLYTSTEI